MVMVRNPLAVQAALKRVERAADYCRNSNPRAEEAICAMGAWSEMKSALEHLKDKVGPALVPIIEKALAAANGEAEPGG